jgi:hypothetical protein
MKDAFGAVNTVFKPSGDIGPEPWRGIEPDLVIVKRAKPPVQTRIPSPSGFVFPSFIGAPLIDQSIFNSVACSGATGSASSNRATFLTPFTRSARLTRRSVPLNWRAIRATGRDVPLRNRMVSEPVSVEPSAFMIARIEYSARGGSIGAQNGVRAAARVAHTSKTWKAPMRD